MKESKRNTFTLARCAAMLLFVLIGMCCIPIKAQEKSVVVPSTDITVKEAIGLIEAQTGLIVGVNHDNMDTSRKLRLGSTHTTTDELLSAIVAGTDQTFIKKARHVIIVTNPKPATTSANAKAVVEPSTESSVLQLPAAEPVIVLAADELPDSVVNTYKSVAHTDDGKLFSFSTGDPKQFRPRDEKQPSLALKTNLLGAATLTPNIGVEFGVGRKTTMEITGGFNPWHLDGSQKDNKKLVHLYLQPELRWWTCERFNGHFFGLHAAGAAYNISQHKIPFIDFKKEYRYQGYAVGAGVSYGYSAMLSPGVNLEFTAGFGVWYLNYDRYGCTKCAKDKSSFDKFRFAPTKAGVSLVFMLK